MPIEERFSLSSVPGFLQTQDNSPINEMLSTLLRDPTEFSSIYSEFEFGEDFWQTLLTSFFEDKRGITEQLIGTNCIVLTTLADLALQASPEDFSEFSVLLENLITHAPEEQLSQLMAFVTNLATNVAFLETISSTIESDGSDPSYIQPLNAFMKACFRRMRYTTSSRTLSTCIALLETAFHKLCIIELDDGCVPIDFMHFDFLYCLIFTYPNPSLLRALLNTEFMREKRTDRSYEAPLDILNIGAREFNEGEINLDQFSSQLINTTVSHFQSILSDQIYVQNLDGSFIDVFTSVRCMTVPLLPAITPSTDLYDRLVPAGLDELFFEELEDFAAEIAPHLQSQQIFSATEAPSFQTMSRLHEIQTFEATESDMVVPTIDYPQTPQSNEDREEDAVVPTMFN